MTDLRATAAPPARHPSASVITAFAARPVLAPAIAGLVGLVISLVGITEPSIWYDEAATISAATRDWSELWRMLGTVDAVHGFYYVLMHVVFDLVGYTPFTLRAPSAVAVGLAAALTVVLVRQFAGAGTALLAGLVFCVLPRVTWMGTEGRSYALSAALAVGLTILLVRAVRSTSRWWWVAYTAVAVLSCLTFVYLALVVVAHGFTMAWWLTSAPRAAVLDVLRWLLAAAIAAASVLPLALEIVNQDAQVSWIEPLGVDTPRQVFRTQWFLYADTFAVAAWVLLTAGIAVLLFRSRGFSLAAVVLPALTVPTIALLVATEVYSPLYSPRYLTMCTPFVAIAMVAPIAALWARRVGSRRAGARWMGSRWLPALVLVLVVALAIPSIVQERMPRAKQLSTWSEVADLIREQRVDDGPGSTTAIIWGPVRYHATATARVIAYSYPDAFVDTVDMTITTPAAESGQLWERRGKLLDNLDRLDGADAAYLITSVKRDRRASTTEALASVGWRVTDEWNLVDVNVLRFEPAG